MLRVFVETFGENENLVTEGINVQRVNFENICSNEQGIESFKKFVEQYEKKNDKIIVLTVDSKLSKAYNSFKSLSNNKTIAVINSSLPISGINFILNRIIKNKDKSFEEFEVYINNLSEMINTYYFMFAYML